MIAKYLKSSIGRKQVVAVTGLMLIGFVIVHLLGNLTLYAGPEAFNGYVKKLESLGPLLVVARVILASIFLVHISLTAILVVENRKARKQKYAATLEKGKRSISTRLMPVSGTILLLFLITHLLDFSLNNHVGPDSFIGGESLGLYGLVYNYFQNPVRIIGYLLALLFLCLHLAHAFHSACHTFGIHSDSFSENAKKASVLLGVGLLVGFGSLPLFLKFAVSY